MKIKVTRRNCFLSALSTWRVCVVFGFRVEHWKLDFYEGYTTRTLPSILECNKSIFLLSIMGSCAGKPNLSDFLWRERFFFFAYDSAARIPFMRVFISTCLPLLSSLSPRPIRTSSHLISISFLTCFCCYLAFSTSFRMCINSTGIYLVTLGC